MFSPFKTIVFFGLFFLLFARQAFAQYSQPDTIHALPVHQPIKLDDRLNEPAWQQARKISILPSMNCMKAGRLPNVLM